MNNPSYPGLDFEFDTEDQAREAFKNIPEGWTPEIHPFHDKFIVWARNTKGSAAAIVQSGRLHVFAHGQHDYDLDAHGKKIPTAANEAINRQSGVRKQ